MQAAYAHAFLTMLQATAVATVSCSAQTTAANIIQKLEQMCGHPVITNTGRMLRPKVGLVHTHCNQGLRNALHQQQTFAANSLHSLLPTLLLAHLKVCLAYAWAEPSVSACNMCAL